MSHRNPLTSGTVMRRLAMAVVPALVAVGLVVIPTAPAAAVNYVPCSDVTKPGGLVGAIDGANGYGGGTLTIHLTPGCTYYIPEPAWDYDDFGNKIYTDSGFWEINNTRGYDNALIVEGNGATITRSPGAGRFRFFNIGHLGDVTLKNLTITGGQAAHARSDGYQDSALPGQDGGAIRNEGTLTLDGVTITGNVSGNGENGDDGGSGDGDPAGSGGRGGGIFNSGSLTLIGSTISNNVSGQGGNGGNGLANGGQAGDGGDGGGIYNSGTLSVSSSTITGNTTGWSGGAGSGIFGGPPGTRGSGGGIGGQGTITVTSSLFTSNSVAGLIGSHGGAIGLTQSGTLTVTNSTFVGNTAWRGGALYLRGGNASIRSSTFTGNDATGTGDNITGDVAALDAGAALRFANALLVGNDPTQTDCNTQVVGPAVSYGSLGGLMSDENNGCGTNTVTADAKLEALGSWGGPTQSRLPKSDSPALGAGAAAYCLPVDQRGVPRPASGCDIGAIERVTAPTGAITGPGVVPLNVATGYATTAASVPAGATLAYRWSVTGVTSTISSTTVAAPQITFTASGVPAVRLNVRVANTSDSESVDLTPLTVKVPPADNVAPTIAWIAPTITAANEGDTKHFAYTVSDSNGNPWTVSSGFPTCGTGGTIVGSAVVAGGGSFDCSFPNGPVSPVVKIQVEDSWAATSSVSTTVAVAEVAPTIVVSGPPTPNEGGVTKYTYVIDEPGSDVFTPVTTCVGAGSSKVSGTDLYTGGQHHTTGEFQCRWGNGPSAGSANVSANGGSGSVTTSVQNVAPSINVSGPTPAPENGSTNTTYRYELNTVDPGDKANLTVVPGTPSCGGPGVGEVIGFDATAVVCRFANGPGTALVTSQVKDQDGATSTGGGLTVQVSNVAPTVTVSQPTGPVAEGGTAYYSISATDPGTETPTLTAPAGCTINNFYSGAGYLSAILACTYTDGPATVSRTATVSDGTTTATATIVNQQVTDADPSIAAAWEGYAVYQGQTATLNVGAITDIGPDTPTSIIVHWGDGTSNTYAWPLANSALTHSFGDSNGYYATIDIVDEDGTHLSRAAELRMIVHNSAPVTSLNAPSTALEGVPTNITYTVQQGPNETFQVDYLSCGRDDNYVTIAPTNVVKGAHGGSFTCTWPLGNRSQTIDLRVSDEGGPTFVTAVVNIPNTPVAMEWTSGPTAVYEGGGTVYRFDFHASDSGSLGMMLMTYSLYGGLSLMYGCGDGGTVVSQVPYYYGGTVTGVPFDAATGNGYIECTFSKGPTTARVWLTVGDYMSETYLNRYVSILNSPPTVELTAPAESTVEGAPAVFTYTTGDLGSDQVTVDSISCGPNGTLDSQGDGTFTCVFDDGPADYTATVTVTDGDDTATSSALAHVDNAAPTTIELSGADVYDTNVDYELTIGSVTDAGADTASGWTVNWGDGSTSILTSVTPNPTHQYQDAEPHTITVDVTDEDGSYLGLGSKSVLVADHTPPVLTVPESGTFEGNGTDGLYWGWPRSAVDERDGELEVQCTGYGFYGINFFDIGVNQRDCWAVDAAGNRSDASFTVTVQDTTAPAFSPVNLGNVSAPNSAGAVVNWNDVATDQVDWRVQGVCDTTKNRLFAFGTYTVHCTATDRAGNVGVLDFTFTVGDFSGPVIATPLANVNASATSAAGATATYVTPTATDNLDGVVPVNCLPASGGTFPLGSTTVTCSATDAAANTSTRTFLVIVTDVTAPVFTQPADLLAAPTDADGATVAFELPVAVDAVDAAITVACLPASGALFPLGITTVECSTADDAGNTAQTSFTVNVQDEQAPVVTAPENVSVEATGPDGETVGYTGESAVDAVDDDVDVTCVPASGTVFDIGTTTVSCSATDSEGNTGSDEFTVSIVDTTEPTMPTLENVAVEATDASTPVGWDAVTASDLVDGTIAGSCLPASGSGFALGESTVTCTATDEHDNVGTTSFTVTVSDTTAPELSADDVTVAALTADGTRVEYTPSVTDLVDDDLVADCDPESGSLFAPESTTTVNCTASDLSGNTVSGSFEVRVAGAVLIADSVERQTEVEVSVEIFGPGDYVIIDEGGADEEVRYIESLGSIIFAAPLAHAHAIGTTVSVIDPPLGDTEAPTIVIAALGSLGKGSIAAADVQCTDAGVGVEACEVPPVDTSALGTHTLVVQAWDFNGNVSTQSVSYTVVSAAELGATGLRGFNNTLTVALLLLIVGVGAVLVLGRRENVLQHRLLAIRRSTGLRRF